MGIGHFFLPGAHAEVSGLPVPAFVGSASLDDSLQMATSLTGTVLAMIAQVSVTAGHDINRPKLSETPWTARDTADAEVLRRAYEARPVGSPLSAYTTRIFWRDVEHGSVMQVILLKHFPYPAGDFLVDGSHRPVIFDGGCSVVQSRIALSGSAEFVCNGNA